MHTNPHGMFKIKSKKNFNKKSFDKMTSNGKGPVVLGPCWEHLVQKCFGVWADFSRVHIGGGLAII